MAELYLYRWQALDTRQRLQYGYSVAYQKQTIRDELLARAWFPLHIKPRKRLSRRHWRSEQRILLFHQLADLLNCGIALVDALRFLTRDQRDKGWRALLQQCVQRLTEGESFSQALAAYPTVFPPLFAAMIHAGEITGQLPLCCERIASQQRRQLYLRQKVKKALRHPLIVLGTALALSCAMLIFVLPEFSQLYASLDAPLPGFTRGLLTLAKGLRQYGVAVLISTAIGLAGYRLLRQRWPACQRGEQRLALALPLMGKLLHHRALHQVWLILSMTQRVGLPLATGLETTAQTFSSAIYRQALTAVQAALLQGERFHQALANTALFPALCQQLVRAGEESGELDKMLEQLAQYYEKQAQERADKMTELLEPILLLVTGLLVGALVIALYLPVFQLGNAFGQQ